jgi:pilus assembly protein CpaF
MILMARYSLSVESVRQQIAGALDLIVYVSRLVDGSRRVMTVSQVSQAPSGDMKIEDLFRYEIDSINEKEVIGVHKQFSPTIPSRIYQKLTTSGLLDEYRALFPTEVKIDKKCD